MEDDLCSRFHRPSGTRHIGREIPGLRFAPSWAIFGASLRDFRATARRDGAKPRVFGASLRDYVVCVQRPVGLWSNAYEDCIRRLATTVEEMRMCWLEILSHLSVIVASVTAVYGVGAWRSAYIGQRRIALAEEAMALFSEAQDVIRNARSDFSAEYESSDREVEDGESCDVRMARDAAHVVLKRLRSREDLFARLRALRYRYEAAFGKESVEPFSRLTGVIAEVRVAAPWYPKLIEKRQKHPEDIDEAKIKRCRNTIWSDSEGDNIAPTVEEAVKMIEERCERLARKHGPVWRRWRSQPTKEDDGRSG